MEKKSFDGPGLEHFIQNPTDTTCDTEEEEVDPKSKLPKKPRYCITSSPSIIFNYQRTNAPVVEDEYPDGTKLHKNQGKSARFEAEHREFDSFSSNLRFVSKLVVRTLESAGVARKELQPQRLWFA